MAAIKERSIGLPQFLMIIAVAVVVFLGWDFGRRVLDTMDLLQRDAQAQVRLDAATQVNSQLKDVKGQVMTDDWVERYARNKWHWDREGEVVVVPIGPSAGAAKPAPAPTPPPPPAKPGWQQWLDSLINAIFGPAS